MLESGDMQPSQMLSWVSIGLDFHFRPKIIKLLRHCRRIKACWQTKLKTSSNIGRDKSFVDDLNKERGIVRMRVAFVPRSAEIQPTFWRFVITFTHQSPLTAIWLVYLTSLIIYCFYFIFLHTHIIIINTTLLSSTIKHIRNLISRTLLFGFDGWTFGCCCCCCCCCEIELEIVNDNWKWITSLYSCSHTHHSLF